jgi:hypothetical protein
MGFLQNFLNKNKPTTADRQIEELKAESLQFKLPEANPWIFYLGKGVAFFILGALNIYVFHHTIPGAFGWTIGISALITELTALYLWQIAHKCVGKHKATVIAFAFAFTAFSIFHAFIGYLTLRGYDFPFMKFYSGFVAFPLMIILWVSCILLTPLMHPIANVIKERSKQETRIAIEQGETLALASQVRQEALKARLIIDGKREEAILQQEVITVAENVAQGRLAARSFADSIRDPEINQEILNILGLGKTKAQADHIDQMSDRSH